MRRAALVAIVVLTASPAYAQIVERVIDGDTVEVAGIGTVRLIGVDAPELTDARPVVLEAARQARAFLQGLVGGRTIRLEYEQQRRDQYGRALAYLSLADGTLVNAEIIKQGYSLAYTQYPFRFLREFRVYEAEARKAGRGLWGTGAAETMAAAISGGGEIEATTVYVTRTGERYHRAGCRSLARSQIPLPLAEAAARYSACSICKPPILAGGSADGVAHAPPTPRAVPATPPAASGRCQAITRRGTQCSRRAQAGRNYCWQH